MTGDRNEIVETAAYLGVRDALDFHGEYMGLLADVHVLQLAYEAHRGEVAAPFHLYDLEKTLRIAEPGMGRRALSEFANAGLANWGGRAWHPISITDPGLTATREHFADKPSRRGRAAFPLSADWALARLRRGWANDVPVAAIFGQLPEGERNLVRWLIERPSGTASYTLGKVYEDVNGRELDLLWTTKMQALGLIERFADGGLTLVRVSEALAGAFGQPLASRG